MVYRENDPEGERRANAREQLESAAREGRARSDARESAALAKQSEEQERKLAVRQQASAERLSASVYKPPILVAVAVQLPRFVVPWALSMASIYVFSVAIWIGMLVVLPASFVLTTIATARLARRHHARATEHELERAKQMLAELPFAVDNYLECLGSLKFSWLEFTIHFRSTADVPHAQQLADLLIFAHTDMRVDVFAPRGGGVEFDVRIFPGRAMERGPKLAWVHRWFQQAVSTFFLPLGEGYPIERITFTTTQEGRGGEPDGNAEGSSR